MPKPKSVCKIFARRTNCPRPTNGIWPIRSRFLRSARKACARLPMPSRKLRHALARHFTLRIACLRAESLQGAAQAGSFNATKNRVQKIADDVGPPLCFELGAGSRCPATGRKRPCFAAAFRIGPRAQWWEWVATAEICGSPKSSRGSHLKRERGKHAERNPKNFDARHRRVSKQNRVL